MNSFSFFFVFWFRPEAIVCAICVRVSVRFAQKHSLANEPKQKTVCSVCCRAGRETFNSEFVFETVIIPTGHSNWSRVKSVQIIVAKSTHWTGTSIRNVVRKVTSASKMQSIWINSPIYEIFNRVPTIFSPCHCQPDRSQITLVTGQIIVTTPTMKNQQRHRPGEQSIPVEIMATMSTANRSPKMCKVRVYQVDMLPTVTG